MRRSLFIALALSAPLGPAWGETPTPFAAPSAPQTPVFKILAPAQSFDPSIFAEFEEFHGVNVLVDAIDAGPAPTSHLRLSGYDLVLLPTAALKRAAEKGDLREWSASALSGLRKTPPDLAKKFAAYGAAARFAVPYEWTAVGIAYDSQRAVSRVGGPPTWASLFQPDTQRLLLDCGLALPDERDALFFGAWKALGVDPAKAQEMNVAPAAFLVTRARKNARVFGANDIGGVFATGGACIGVATFGEVASARARSPANGDVDVRFAAPKDGAGIIFDALASPKDATDADKIEAMLAFLARPDIASKNAAYSGNWDAFDANFPTPLANLEPLGGMDQKVEAKVDAAWTSARLSEPPQLPPKRPRAVPAHLPFRESDFPSFAHLR